MRFSVAFVAGQALVGHHLGNGATMPPWPSEPVYIREEDEPQ
jgi:hypothetical protein